MRTSKALTNVLDRDSVSLYTQSTTRQKHCHKHSRDAPQATLGTCMLPRPLSRPLGRMIRLPSNGELLARTHTTASGRSLSRLTRHGARDNTMCKSCDISMQRARTHALACAPTCTWLRSGSAPTPGSRSPHAPITYARLQPNLPTAGLPAASTLEPPEEHGNRTRR